MRRLAEVVCCKKGECIIESAIDLILSLRSQVAGFDLRSQVAGFDSGFVESVEEPVEVTWDVSGAKPCPLCGREPANFVGVKLTEVEHVTTRCFRCNARIRYHSQKQRATDGEILASAELPQMGVIGALGVIGDLPKVVGGEPPQVNEPPKVKFREFL